MTGTVSPAVNSSARYSTGMRSWSIAANRLPVASASSPVSATTSTTGDSGGMYQTIGIVRYSGCSGSATLYVLISDQIGERCAASIQSCGMPARSASRTTSGSCGSQNTAALRLQQVVLVGHRRGLQHLVGVVEHEPDVPQPADARLRADRRQAHLDAREAERALLGLAGAVVEVDLLVRAAGHALAPAPALVLVDQHDAVLGPLVDGPRGARRGARRVEAVLADARQVEHERLLELELDLLGHLGQDRVAAPRSRRCHPGRRPSWRSTRSAWARR